MKFWDELQRMSPYTSPAKGCAQVLYAFILGVFTCALSTLLFGSSRWEELPGQICIYMGCYWAVSTVFFAVAAKRMANRG